MSYSLPEDVRDALNRGDKITAIRLLRERTGIGLAEAKAAVEAGVVSSPPEVRHSSDQLPAQVRAALMAGSKIEAIKLLREATGLGLKEAKDKVDAASMQSGIALESGEVPRRWFSSGFALMLAVLVAAVVGWILFGGW
jgi:ribosomal protein L7/L12